MAPPNMRMKLSRRGGHLWWNAKGKPSFLNCGRPNAQLMRDSLGLNRATNEQIIL